LGGFFVKGAGGVVGVEGRALGVAAGENREDGRENEEGGEGAEGEAAEDGAAERGDLVAAFAETEGEGRHAGAHGERGHEDGAEAGGGALERGGDGIGGSAAVAATLYQETDESVQRRATQAERHRLFREPSAEIKGRPTKRDRRLLDRSSS
jgi:hypothetical protein